MVESPSNLLLEVGVGADGCERVWRGLLPRVGVERMVVVVVVAQGVVPPERRCTRFSSGLYGGKHRNEKRSLKLP